MIERYAKEKMKNIWTQNSRYSYWLKVELAAVWAWNKLGVIPDEDCKKILKNANFDTKRIDEIELQTKHDVIAFLTSVSEFLGDESRWVHYALTSSDCIDTAFALQIKDSLDIILQNLNQTLKIIKKQALKHKHTLQVGRSHGIHGEPISFGLVLGIWYEEIKRAKKLIKYAKKNISYGKLSGAMGNFAHAPLELEELTCKKLGLKAENISNQIIQRDRHAVVIQALALLASVCEQIAVAIRHYQRTEVYECEEFFSQNQKGSSAMPHKRNPVLSENITGLARVIRSFATPSLENIALWHERDISHSSVERFIFPDSFITSNFMIERLNSLIENLQVYPENMMKNLNLTGGLVFSQRVLLQLPLKGLSRENAYKIVQKNAMKVWSDLKEGKKAQNEKNESLFLQYLLEDKDLNNKLTKEEIKECFDYNYYTKNIDKIFKRVFGE